MKRKKWGIVIDATGRTHSVLSSPAILSGRDILRCMTCGATAENSDAMDDAHRRKWFEGHVVRKVNP